MTFDLVVANARVIDGTGNPWFRADVGVDGDKIIAITPAGRLARNNARELVDAGDLYLCPGFIDVQSHSVLTLMRDGRSVSKITQGVTTEIMGESWTPAPFGGKIADPFSQALFQMDVGPEWTQRIRNWRRFGDWLRTMEEIGVSPNVGSFLGGGTVRNFVKGMTSQKASKEDVKQMRRVAAESMEDGAFGISYALIYAPDGYADTAEIIELCKEVAGRGGLYITHLRSESTRIFEALEEAMEIGHEADIAVEVYHLKVQRPAEWWRMPSVIDRITRARHEGLDISANMYPYSASGTGLNAILPLWVSADGKLFENLKDPDVRRRVRDEMEPSSTTGQRGLGTIGGPSGVMPIDLRSEENLRYRGMRLTEIAEARGQDWIDAAMDLLSTEDHRITTIFFGMDEGNLRLQARQPWVTFASDAGGMDPAWARDVVATHPRSYGTFPKIFRKFVKEDGFLTVEEAVRKMTSAVANRIGLRKRGAITEGHFADLVLMDLSAISDRATYEDAHQLSEGVRDVWVNGVRVLESGAHTGRRPGRFVKGPGAR